MRFRLKRFESQACFECLAVTLPDLLLAQRQPDHTMNTINIEWKDSYLFNDVLIDRQHQEIFTLANAVIHAADQSAFRLAALELYRYMRKHFSDEKALMREINFPDYKNHIELHNSLLSRFKAIVQEIVLNGHWNRDDIHSFMAHDYGKHLEEEDAKIAVHNRMCMA
jgi:hemerythrin-like metal-binding protein